MSQQEPETTQRQPHPRRSRQSRRSPVMGYLAILFAVAFLLLLWAYFQQQRSNTEATDALKQSASAVQSIQNLIDDNDALRQENETLKEQTAQLEKELADSKAAAAQAQGSLDESQLALQAMDYFWQIDEAFARQRYSLCRELILEMENKGLDAFLPDWNATENDRYAPAQRYEEIKKAVT